jgi:hypothetical protein
MASRTERRSRRSARRGNSDRNSGPCTRRRGGYSCAQLPHRTRAARAQRGLAYGGLRGVRGLTGSLGWRRAVESTELGPHQGQTPRVNAGRLAVADFEGLPRRLTSGHGV